MHGLGQSYFPPSKTLTGAAGAAAAAYLMDSGASASALGYCRPRIAEAAPFEEFLHIGSACTLQATSGVAPVARHLGAGAAHEVTQGLAGDPALDPSIFG